MWVQIFIVDSATLKLPFKIILYCAILLLLVRKVETGFIALLWCRSIL